MARPKNTVPTYKQHSPSGTARCWVGDKWVSLGKYNSPESRAEYARIIADLGAAPKPVAIASPRPGEITVNELLLGFLRHAEQHYRRADGTPSRELPQFAVTFKLLRQHYGSTPAREFGPLALKVVRRQMIAANWCRNLINQRIGRVKRAFKWAVSEELIPASVSHALHSVPGLQAGRTPARETAPVAPVDEAVVTATLPYLRPAVAAMVQVQLLTGARPGEVCQLRPCGIDTSGAVWLFRPTQHKTRHRGKSRTVSIGPNAQTILERFRPAVATDHFFSPRRVVAELHAERAANRQTPMTPSHRARAAARLVAKPEPKHADAYTVTAYDRAVERAVVKANREMRQDADIGPPLPTLQHWSPNRLRHTHGTRVRKAFGLEAAQVALGHSRADVTQVYAERNDALAAQVATAIG